MPQDPDKPRAKAGIRMPSVDGAMNKIAPRGLGGGKGSDKDARMLGETRKGRGHDDLLARVLKRMDRAISVESDNRKDALDDLKMKAGDQWSSSVVAQRNLDQRPCLTINKLPTFVHQVTNSQRENRPAININPVGDRGDPEVAKMYRGLIRAIERDSAADIAYDTAFDNAVSNGFGYWRVLTEHEAPDSFNQVAVIRRIRNPFTVYLDPNHIEPDGSDARWGFISEMMPRDDFEAEYPDADPMPFTQAGIGDTAKHWITKDEIRIAEYFEIRHEARTLVALDNGHEGWEDELADETLTLIDSGDLNIVERRESFEPKIKAYKLTAKEVLEENDWAGKWIPIVKVIGDEIDIEGKVKLSGVIRNSKDAQRMYNYWSTAETELIALAPKAPWIMEEGQVEGHEDTWKMANIRSNPYLLYKATSIAGHPAPPPQRQQFAGVPAGVVQAKEGSAQDMMATTGIRFDATMNERMIDESGRAIRELRRSGDIGSFHYIDNLARSLRHTGAILVDLIPKIYDTKRIITILREDDSEEHVQIDPNAAKPMQETKHPTTGKTLKIFNPTYGKYGVTVTIGPSYASKRIEASENMMAFAKALPNVGAMVADLIAKNQDWPGAEEFATRLAKTLPPNLLAPDIKDVPPQVQAMIQAMDGQIKQLGQQLQQAMTALNDKQADRAVDLEKINKDFEAKALNIMMQMETKMAAVQQQHADSLATHIGSQIKDLAQGVNMLMGELAKPKKPNGEADGKDV